MSNTATELHFVVCLCEFLWIICAAIVKLVN